MMRVNWSCQATKLALQLTLDDASAGGGLHMMVAQVLWRYNSNRCKGETHYGFVKLTSLDGTPIRIEQGNIALSSAGTTGGVQAGFNDLEVLGFRETKGQVTLDDVRLTMLTQSLAKR